MTESVFDDVGTNTIVEHHWGKRAPAHVGVQLRFTNHLTESFQKHIILLIADTRQDPVILLRNGYSLVGKVKSIFRDYNSFGTELTTNDNTEVSFEKLVGFENWRKE